MKTVSVSANQGNENLRELCAKLFEENLPITLAADSTEAKKVVDSLRSFSDVIDGNKINPHEYGYYLLRALQDNYISSLDEFATLLLKICIACDYKTVVTTKNIIDENILSDEHFIQVLLDKKISPSCLTYITFIIQEADYKPNALIVYEFRKCKQAEKIMLHGSNIPVSDIRKLENGNYEVRLASFEVIKAYYETYFWCPIFYYRFGVSSQYDIFNSLKRNETPGRIIGLWCPDSNIENFEKIHDFTANNSLVTLHDVIHLSILSSYPIELVTFVYNIIDLMLKNLSQDARWSEHSLSWLLADFAISHENTLVKTNITELFASLLKSVLYNIVDRNIDLTMPLYKKMVAPIFFSELLLLIRQNKLENMLDPSVLFDSINADIDLKNYPNSPDLFYSKLIKECSDYYIHKVNGQIHTLAESNYIKYFLTMMDREAMKTFHTNLLNSYSTE